MAPKKKKLKSALQNVLASANASNIKKHKLAAQEKQRKNTQKKKSGGQQQQQRHRQQSQALYSTDTILLIGEGNFSFARSLVENHLTEGAEQLTATCYDSEDVLYEKYEEARENIEIIRSLGGTVLFGIDGTQLSKHKQFKNQTYSRIIFNFPHAGAGIKDQDRNVRANQELLRRFFVSAAELLSSEGEIRVTIKTCKPYDLWAIRGLAKTSGLAVKTAVPFDPSDFPGYEHRRTLGFKEGLSKSGNEEILQSDPKTYIFVPKAVMQDEIEKSAQGMKQEKNTKKRKHEDSDEE
ncbi:hypothetical protein EC973_000023 [Apophysomyces ossiformis]|uniref:25S rRNA (uridine-N(3))-methyltransferase BMT5-like domain-containing protein n=1 Tax=Apophysomyces ossiformis TaxID=679940 RepID=A0A8H7BWB5_9FUNG|nr:hypothetical protein EC973_000023 [Apophysomyces ossiformis]